MALQTDVPTPVAVCPPAEPPCEKGVPQYVRVLWRSLKRFAASPKVKRQLAEIFARQLDGFKVASGAHWPRHGPPGAAANFVAAERLGLLACALTQEEVGRLIDAAEAMLMGTPCEGRSELWPVTC